MNTNYFDSTICGFAEKDTYAATAYKQIHGVSSDLNWSDVRDIDYNQLAREHFGIEFLFCGSPCSGFSNCGTLKGVEWKCLDCGHTYNPLDLSPAERSSCPECGSSENISQNKSSHVLYFLKAIHKLQPKVCIFENLSTLATSKRFKSTFNKIIAEIQSAGYVTYHKIMNCRDYCQIPMNREHVFIVAIRDDINKGFWFPFPLMTTLNVSYFLDDCANVFRENPDTDVVIDPCIPPSISQNIQREIDSIISYRKGIYRPSCTSNYQGNEIGVSYIPTIRSNNGSTIALQKFKCDTGIKYYIKKLTARERFRFMGFSDEDYDKASRNISEAQLKKAAGNSVVVDMLELIMEELLYIYPELFQSGRTFSMFSGLGSFEAAMRNVINRANENQE